jgi:hypothetical protein
MVGWKTVDNYFSNDRSQDSVFETDRPMVSYFHPTTKPVELIARMIASSSRPGELYLTHSPVPVQQFSQRINSVALAMAASSMPLILLFNWKDFHCKGLIRS